MTACWLAPWASMVTTAGKSLTSITHMASGTPKSSLYTPRTRVHGLGDQRCSPADGVQVDAGHFLAGCQGLGTHAALADHAFDLEMAHHVALVGFLARAGGRTGGHKAVLAWYPARRPPDRSGRSAPAFQQGLDGLVDLQVIALGLAGLLDKGFYHPFVHRVAPGEHHAG